MSEGAALQGELQERRDLGPGVSVIGTEKRAGLGGGGLEGADRIGRELATWRPMISSPDTIINKDKLMVDGRARDMQRNSGPMQGAANVHKDSIVGSQYRLNVAPAFRTLGLDEKWAEDFQIEVEEKFTLYAESPECWIDVQGRNTLTDMVRLAVGCYFTGGEVTATMNWMTGINRPLRTSMQMIDADRVSNPNDAQDDKFLRRGIKLDKNGRPLGAWVRRAHPNEVLALADRYSWEYWAVRKTWGRLNFLHILEQQRPDQNRGIADMVSVLKETRMGKKFHEVALANAIVQASYAMAIESELPPEMAFQSLGGEDGVGFMDANLSLLQGIAEYSRGAKNLEIDGVKIPHLFPGTKLKMMPAGVPGGIGEKLEQSLNRNISAALGMSYEEYTHDFSQTNYSSSKAAANKTMRFMESRKRIVGDATANAIYINTLEEMITEGHLECMKPIVKRDPEFFYRPFHKEALTRATWIGSSRGQVDELKETQAAVLRINSGMSTFEKECAKLGNDYRDVFKQKSREEALRKALKLDFSGGAVKPGTMSTQRKTGSQDQTEEDDDDGLD